MTPETLKKTIAEIRGEGGQIAMARELIAAGVLKKNNPKNLSRMISGEIPVDPGVVEFVEKRLEIIRASRAKHGWLERAIDAIDADAPRAGTIHVRILLALDRLPSGQRYPIRDLCEDLRGDPNNTAVHSGIARLERLGLVAVDRGGPIQGGYGVRLSAR